jgi:signal transduction histidine kinase/CheY-like chemotaxis protein
MSKPVLSVEVRLEQDVVLARQRARQIAGLFGFETQDQTRFATAVSEMARNAFQYAAGGRIEFSVAPGTTSAAPSTLLAKIQDRGKGIANLKSILEGNYRSPTGMGRGIVGVRRLMDQFRIESVPGEGTTVELGKSFPKHCPAINPQDVARVVDELVRRGPQNAFEEARQQNLELLQTLDALRKNQDELSLANKELLERQAALNQLNRELEDTNRGVVALYAELDEKADFLKRASETKSRFLSNMSHEFRTPLNAITGLARILLDRTDGELTSEQEKQVTLIRRSAEDLTELVNDLLDLAKVEAGKVTIRAFEFEARTLFAALRGLLRPLLAHNSAVVLIFEEAVGIPCLHTDESKLSQILRNFISNALKFTERGEVRVSVEVRPQDFVAFTVADTGVGIAPQDHDLIFEEFTQVEGPRQKYVKGTGLGLPLVRKLASLLGGHIEMKSELGVGSSFTVVIPRNYHGPAEVVPVPEVSAQVDPSRRPVLVIEDNRETLFIYEKYLKGTGYQVIPARTLKAARQALGRFRPAAVILDVLLENENTWELLGELKRAESTRDIPIIVITLVENEDKTKALGADAFAAKPVERAWLLSQLQRSTLHLTPEKILLIDDDEASRYLLKSLLHGSGFGVAEAVDANEGLERARKEPPLAVFLDLDLPDQSGFEVLEALRRESATSNIPVIIHSARLLSEGERARLSCAGAAAILPKGILSRQAGTSQLRDILSRAGLIATTVN